MSFNIKQCPSPEELPALKPLLEHKGDQTFIKQLEESLAAADRKAQNGGLDPKLYQALPNCMGLKRWPKTFKEYVHYLCVYSRWIPQQSDDPAWADPTDLEEHQEVYDYLCWFHWLIDQPLASLRDGVLQDIPWFAEFLVLWARDWGMFLDSEKSFDDEILNSFRCDSPKYRVQDSMIPEVHHPDKLRPNIPGKRWHSFNQFFARELNPGLRPVTYPGDNTTLTVPADCTYKKAYGIDETGQITPSITLKGTHTYATVQQLLDKSRYADAFNGGHFIHLFLGPYSYHRFHTPVAGIVRECYPLTGEVYLKVSLSGGQFDAADSASDGYEFTQARGILTIDTTGSPYGDVGIVAVIPVGMCQVSGVNMTHESSDMPHKKEITCLKGDEFGYFTFGGSDIIILTQKGTDPQWNPKFVENTSFYSHYGTLLGQVTPLR